MNPARDFGPRVAHAILPISNKGNSDWSYALVPIVGPLIAAAIGAAIIKLAGIR
jgi:glycerol uptake facilitator protein